MGKPQRAVTLKLSLRPAGAGDRHPDAVSTAGPQQPGPTAAWPQPQPCTPAPNFTPCLIQSQADCKLPAYLPDREFLASSKDRLLPCPAGCPPAHPCKPFCTLPPTPTAPSGPTELILFSRSVNLNSFKYAFARSGWQNPGA
jgi:hypothetical protein